MSVVPKYLLSLPADIYEDNYDDPDLNPPPRIVAPFLLKVSRTDEPLFTVEGIDPVAGRTRFAVALSAEEVDALIDAAIEGEVFKIVRNPTDGSAALEVGNDDDADVNVVVISDPNPGPPIGPKELAFAMRLGLKGAKRQKRSASVAIKALASRRKKESKAG
jgi:hypothetical protein